VRDNLSRLSRFFLFPLLFHFDKAVQIHVDENLPGIDQLDPFEEFVVREAFEDRMLFLQLFQCRVRVDFGKGDAEGGKKGSVDVLPIAVDAHDGLPFVVHKSPGSSCPGILSEHRIP